MLFDALISATFLIMSFSNSKNDSGTIRCNKALASSGDLLGWYTAIVQKIHNLQKQVTPKHIQLVEKSCTLITFAINKKQMTCYKANFLSQFIKSTVHFELLRQTANKSDSSNDGIDRRVIIQFINQSLQINFAFNFDLIKMSSNYDDWTPWCMYLYKT